MIMDLNKKELDVNKVKNSHRQDSVLSEDDLEERIYTLDEVMEEIGFGPFQLLITLFCGLLLLIDHMEFMLLAILSPAVKCQWNLSGFEEAMISSIVFIGALLGSPFWGVIFDIIGRKKGLFIVDIIILIFGLLSALKLSPGDDKLPGYPWLLICRFGVGFAAGGIPQAVTYYTEFLPLKGRGTIIALLGIWWSLGTMFGASVAIGVMGKGGLGWHWYLGFCAIPPALVLPMFLLAPESARYYLVKGKHEEVQKVIKRVAFYNCKKPPQGRIVTLEEKQILEDGQRDTNQDTENCNESKLDSSGDDDNNLSKENRSMPKSNAKRSEESKSLLPAKTKSVYNNILSNLSLIFTDGTWKTTVILVWIWLGSGWLFYGTLLLTTSLLQENPHCDINSRNNNMSNNTSSGFIIDCDDTGDYLKILWTIIAAEFPGLLIIILLIDILGRKWTIIIECMATLVGFLLLFICSSKIILTLSLFLIRATTSGIFKAVHVYTPEVYPTKARAFGIGVCSSAARIGAIITPYSAQVLLYTSFEATVLLYSSSCLVMAVLAHVLPIETKGRALRDTGRT